jgi:hypothetical protein
MDWLAEKLFARAIDEPDVAEQTLAAIMKMPGVKDAVELCLYLARAKELMDGKADA